MSLRGAPRALKGRGGVADPGCLRGVARETPPCRRARRALEVVRHAVHSSSGGLREEEEEEESRRKASRTAGTSAMDRRGTSLESPRSIQRRIARCQTLSEAFGLLEAHSTFLDDVHVASLYNRVSDLLRRSSRQQSSAEALEHLSELVKLRLSSMNTRSLSTVANACGKLRGRDRAAADAVGVLAHVRGRANASLPDFSCVDLENVLWAHGKLGLRLHPEELDSWYTRLAEDCPGRLSEKSLVSLLYTCQRQRYRPPGAVASVLASEIARLAPAMTPKALANLLSSLAHLRSDEMLEPVKLVTALLSRDLEASAERGAGGATAMNLRNVANVLWSFAELQFYPQGRVLDCLDRRVLRLLGEGDGGALALNTYLRACHKLARRPNEMLLESSLEVVSEGLRKVAAAEGAAGDMDMLAQTCRLVKSLAMLNFEVPAGYLSSLERCLVLEGLDHVTAHDSLWTFATAGHAAGGEYKSMATVFVEEGAVGLKRGSLCRMLWSITMLGIPLKDSGLPERVLCWVEENSGWTSHSFGLLLWAMREQGREAGEVLLRRAKEHVRVNWDAMTPTEILYSVEVLGEELGAEDAAWLVPALQRARTFVLSSEEEEEGGL